MAEKAKINIDEESLKDYKWIVEEIKKIEATKPFKDWKTLLTFKLFDFVRTNNDLIVKLNTLGVEDLKKVAGHLIILKESFDAQRIYFDTKEEERSEFMHQNKSFDDWMHDIEKLIENKNRQETLLFLRNELTGAKADLNIIVKRGINVSERSSKLNRFRN